MQGPMVVVAWCSLGLHKMAAGQLSNHRQGECLTISNSSSRPLSVLTQNIEKGKEGKETKRNETKCTCLSVEAVAKRPGTAVQKVSAQAGLS